MVWFTKKPRAAHLAGYDEAAVAREVQTGDGLEDGVHQETLVVLAHVLQHYGAPAPRARLQTIDNRTYNKIQNITRRDKRGGRSRRTRTMRCRLPSRRLRVPASPEKPLALC